MIEVFAFGFVQRAFLAGIAVAVACAFLGTFLMLRRLSLIGDGLAHIAFGGIALGLLFRLNPFFSALVFSLIGAFAIAKLRTRLYTDTAIAIISHASLGIGIFVISIARSFNADILSYLFGSILTVTVFEVIEAIIIAAVVVLVIVFLYQDLFSISFDESTAKTQGLNVEFLNIVLVGLTALTVVLAMKLVGLLLAAALLTLPAATSLQISKSFRSALSLSVVFAVGAVIVGLILSIVLNTAPAGTIILVNFFVFLVVIIIKKIGDRNRSAREYSRKD